MKFKLIFVLFNIILLFLFVFILILPLFVLGIEASGMFWAQNWYLFGVFLLVLAALDGYFLNRWKFFTYLEAENWKDLSAWLEQRVFSSKILSGQNVKFLFRTWLIQGRLDDSLRLEAFIREKHPKSLQKFARLLGLVHLLKNDPEDLSNFYSAFQKAKYPDLPWLRLGYALGLSGQNKFAEARELFLLLAQDGHNPLCQALALYIIKDWPVSEETEKADYAKIKAALKEKIPRDKLLKIKQERQDDLELLVLSKVLDEAMNYLYD